MCLGGQERRRRGVSPSPEHSLTPPASSLLRALLTGVQGGHHVAVDGIGAEEGEDDVLPGLANDTYSIGVEEKSLMPRELPWTLATTTKSVSLVLNAPGSDS